MRPREVIAEGRGAEFGAGGVEGGAEGRGAGAAEGGAEGRGAEFGAGGARTEEPRRKPRPEVRPPLPRAGEVAARCEESESEESPE